MFKKYMHIERIDSKEVDGLLIGTVYVQPKIDGSNCQLWYEEGVVRAGSRNIVIEGDHMGFNTWLQKNDLTEFFKQHPNWRLYGEWLVKHTLKTYRDEAWHEFYVFDVYDDEKEEFVHYDDYKDSLGTLNYIPVIAVITNPTIESLQKIVDKNTFLIKEGAGYGEGIVIKRYDFKNKYDRIVWGKMVRNDFRDKHVKEMGAPEIKLSPSHESKFVEKYVTKGRVDKEKAKIENWSNKQIPQLFGRVYHDIITTELWEYIKDNNNKITIDFNLLYQHTVNQIKKTGGL